MPTIDTKTRLLDAAQTLVQQLGANAMSYQHLADAVGIRKASIHYYFPTKGDLLVALIDRYQAYFLGLVEKIAQGSGTGAAKLKKYCQLFENTLAANNCDRACPCGMLGAEIATLEPEAAKHLQAFYAANAKALAGIFEIGHRDGTLHFTGKAESLAWTTFSLLEGAMMTARVCGGIPRFRTQTRQLEKLLTP